MLTSSINIQMSFHPTRVEIKKKTFKYYKDYVDMSPIRIKTFLQTNMHKDALSSQKENPRTMSNIYMHKLFVCVTFISSHFHAIFIFSTLHKEKQILFLQAILIFFTEFTHFCHEFFVYAEENWNRSHSHVLVLIV